MQLMNWTQFGKVLDTFYVKRKGQMVQIKSFSTTWRYWGLEGHKIAYKASQIL